MYLSKEGFSEVAVQYECSNLPQVKTIISEITNTKTCNDDWKEFCYSIKKYGGSDSVDYICFINGVEYDCSVNIGYDNNTKTYLVWISDIEN